VPAVHFFAQVGFVTWSLATPRTKNRIGRELARPIDVARASSGPFARSRAHLLKRPEVALRKWSVSQRVNSSRTAGDDHTLIEPALAA
jgi:hypothetical protein